MGDVIEITTWPKHQNLFYLVTGSGITFDVKAVGNAAVGLSRKLGSTCDYWVGIGDNHRCWINKGDEHCKSVNTHNILDNNQYRSFWLVWNGGSIRFGRQGENKPIVAYANKIPDLKYITFSVMKDNNPVQWRFELAPVRPRVGLKPITGGKLTWVDAESQLPDESLIGGYKDEVLYIIRASHRGSLTPGTFIASEGVGYISWGGDAHEKTEFQVLCGFDCTWVPTWEDRIPVGAVVGGYSEVHQERLYVGRAIHNGHTVPGKVQPSHKVCYIPFEGREIAKKKYEILVEANNMRCVNSTFISDLHIESASESDQDDDHTWQADDDDEEMFEYDSNEDINEVMAL